MENKIDNDNLQLFIEKIKKIEEIFAVNRYYFSYVISNILPKKIEDIPIFEEYMERQNFDNHPLFKLVVSGNSQSIQKIEEQIKFNDVSQKISTQELPISSFNNFKK